MADDMDNWTPAIGWKKAAIKIGLRSLFCLAICLAGLELLYLTASHFGVPVLPWRFVAPIGLLLGLLQGWVLGRDMVDSTGIGAWPLAMAITVAMLVLGFGLYQLAVLTGMFHPSVPFYFLGPSLSVAAITAGGRMAIE